MRKNVYMSPLENIQMIAMDEVGGFRVRPGLYELYGATALPGAVNFTLHTHGATSVELLLFKRTETEPYAVLKFPESYRIGDVYAMIVFDLNIENFEYAYRVDGPNNPRRGITFDKNRILLDPYAKAVTGQSVWGEKHRKKDFYKARVVRNDFDWGTDRNPLLPMEDLVIYELHVRGFTKHKSSGVRNPGTFDGLREKIPYLRDLGINAVELMPIFEFDEMRDDREVDGKKMIDYWGYNPISFFAPNTSYASEVEYNREGRELKKLIKALNDNGIECFLDVVFNHTAEQGEGGPFISFKGLDNNVYYMLSPDGRYYNFSGCGNTLNCNHPVVQQLILDSLRYWTVTYHIDGFRFDLASILGRNQDGRPMNNPPLLQNLAFDPILANVKLIAEAWDAGGLYQVGTFPSWRRWAEWNGKYRDDMRDYLKGDISLTRIAARRIMGSEDIYDPASRGSTASVNFLNCHDGFTLWDMYSYSRKHNEANGWNNTDGSDDNRSWNCGEEGETDDPRIVFLRKKLAKNAMAVLFMSRGIPMFLAGDEFLNTQFGNNNAYCQDNEVSWLDWNRMRENADHWNFVRHMIALRKNHPVVRKPCGRAHCGFPVMRAILPDEGAHVLRILYAGRKRKPDGFEVAGREPGAGRKGGHAEQKLDRKGACEEMGFDGKGAFADEDDGDDVVCLAVNVFWEAQMCILPDPAPGYRWEIACDTSEWYLPDSVSRKDMPVYVPGNRIRMDRRSVLVFTMERAGRPM